MFSSINFLFLTSLAITSWIILCYFKQIEEQRMEDIHEHFRIERSFEEPLRACRENYDLYLNFLCIFACIYALAKVTHLTESFIAKHVHAKFLNRNNKTYETERSILEEYKAQQENLVLQINNLKLSNNQLEQQLQQSREQLELQLRESKTQLEQQLHQLQQNNKVFVMGNMMSHEGEEPTMNDKALFKSTNNSSNSNSRSNSHSNSTSSFTNSNNNNNNHNIFISNRHIHVNRQVYVNEGNVKLQLPNFKQDAGGFSQIWSKYLEMQKYAIKTPVAKNQAARANPVPIVVSTEQLQTIQGLY